MSLIWDVTDRQLIDLTHFTGLLVWGIVSGLIITLIIGYVILKKVIVLCRPRDHPLDFPFRTPPTSPARSQSMPLLTMESADSTINVEDAPVSHRTRSHVHVIKNPTYDSCI